MTRSGIDAVKASFVLQLKFPWCAATGFFSSSLFLCCGSIFRGVQSLVALSADRLMSDETKREKLRHLLELQQLKRKRKAVTKILSFQI